MTEAEDEQFTVWLNNQPTAPGQLRCPGPVIKKGPRIIKTVTLAEYGNQDTGEVRRRQLTGRTSPRDTGGPGYDFDHPTSSWSCENEEIDRVLAFLTTEVEQSGRYRLHGVAGGVDRRDERQRRPRSHMTCCPHRATPADRQP